MSAFSTAIHLAFFQPW